MAALPYKNSKASKKNQVAEMFDNISARYDLLNHLLSVNIDKIWRSRAVKMLAPYQSQTILDVATGTGDFAIATMKLNPRKVTGIDISEGMLEVGKKKIHKKGYSQKIELLKADSEALPFSEASFDAAVVGFGVRNFEHLEQGLAEIFRVLRPGGIFVVLEFSRPRKSPFKQLYSFYFSRILPFIGRLVSKDSRAYNYLPESVGEFPDRNDFIKILENTGFADCNWNPQTFGIASIYKAQKPEN